MSDVTGQDTRSLCRAVVVSAAGEAPTSRQTVDALPAREPQSAGSSAQSGPLTSPGPARSAASTIVYA